MVTTTVFVAPSITVTVWLSWFATYKSPLSGLKAMATGSPPCVWWPQLCLLPSLSRRRCRILGLPRTRCQLSGLRQRQLVQCPRELGPHNCVCIWVYHRNGVVIDICRTQSPLLGLKAMAIGFDPIGKGMAPPTAFVAGSITETVLPTWFATYKSPLSGLKAMPLGNNPTGMVAITAFVAPSITVTVWLSWFATYKARCRVKGNGNRA